MSEFATLLRKFNGGHLRGAKTKLAKALKVNLPYVSDITNGVRPPGEETLGRMAVLLGTTKGRLQEILLGRRAARIQSVSEEPAPFMVAEPDPYSARTAEGYRASLRLLDESLANPPDDAERLRADINTLKAELANLSKEVARIQRFLGRRKAGRVAGG